MVELLKLYGIRERAIKRARDLEALLDIKKEQDVELEFNILVRKIHKLDNEIFEAERKLQNIMKQKIDTIRKVQSAIF